MQVAATIVPALHLPDVITSAVVVVALLGFPIALVLAWVFDLTQGGLKRTDADDTAPNARRRSRLDLYRRGRRATCRFGLFFAGRYTAPDKQRARQLSSGEIDRRSAL